MSPEPRILDSEDCVSAPVPVTSLLLPARLLLLGPLSFSTKSLWLYLHKTRKVEKDQTKMD